MKTDPVLLEILRNRFGAIVEEMASVTLRTGFTVFVKETSDFGTVLVAPNGEVLAAPTETSVSLMVGLPGWEAIRAFDSYEPGDVGVSNDPDRTRGLSTHLPDIWVWRPIFVDGEIVAFAFNFIHSSDVGGRVPGSILPSNSDIFQEGLRIPPVKLVKAGVLNQDVVDFILLNCRIPDQNWGDIKAMLASLTTAERRMQELAGRYGLDTVRQGITDLLALAESRGRALIRRIPNGVYRASDYMEAEFAGLRPIRLALAMTVEDEEIVMDFTGTDLQVQAALNLPTYNQPGHYFMVLALLFWFRTLDPEIPYNSGLTRPIHMVLPQGSILNPDPGLAYGVRAATSFRVMDMILACLAQAMPDQVPAAPAGAIGISLVAMRDPETGEQRISVAQPLSGGSGGRPGIDGIDGTSFTGGWLRNVPNEMLEADVPVLVERYGYANGTAAPGEFRGGTGLLFRLRNLAPAAVMTARSLERFTFQPWGFRGGKPGTVGRCRLNPGRNDERELGKIDILSLTQDDVVEFRTPGGGGLGDPFRRAPEKVVADVRAGFLDEAAALRDYGVVLRGGKVDTSATELARARHTPARKLFDGGDQRAAYEAGWPEPMQDALIALLMRHPSAGRAFVRQRVLPVIEAECRAGTPPDRARLEAIFAAAGFRHAA